MFEEFFWVELSPQRKEINSSFAEIEIICSLELGLSSRNYFSFGDKSCKLLGARGVHEVIENLHVSKDYLRVYD